MKLLYYLPLCICFYIAIIILTIFITENIADYKYNDDGLYDTLHNSFDKIISMKYTNYIVFIFMIYCIIRFIFINTRYIGDALILISVLFILRLLTFTLTNVPPPYILKKNKELCKYKLFGKHFGFSFNNIASTCNDFMFSGHTIHIIAFLLFILYFSNNLIEKIVLFCLSLIILFFIINSRMHYTSDVVVAIIITFLLFNYMFITKISH